MTGTMKTMKRFSLALLLAAAASPAFAQQPPAAARGFDPDKVFAAGPIDSINAFNGNVIATIPLGETYTVSPTLAYSFKAIHNGKTWDYVRRYITVAVPCDPPSQSQCTTVWTDMQAVPDGTANAGFGWRVQFARFILPGDLQANTDRTLLETPDGAQHGMYGSLHDGDPQDGASYTRDATYLRWRDTGVAERTAVDTAEGVTYEFTNYKLTQMHDQVKDASGNYVNRVDIQYGSATGDPAWPCAYPAISQKITDTKNRTSYVCFENMNYDGTNRPTVTDVYVGTPAGTGHYEFLHAQTAFARENYDKGYQYLYLPATATVPALMSITRPDDSSYGFQYFGTSANPGIATGNFKSITLPTQGSYGYDYGFYQIPSSYDCPTYLEWLASGNPGVTEREERNANGTVVGRTTYGTNGPSGGVEGGYYQCTTEQEGPGYFSAFAPGAELSNFVIPGDNLSNTVRYYSVWPGYNRLMADSPDGFKRVEYGLPFTRNASKMRGDLFLSTETYLCTDAVNAECETDPIRATYVQYEVDAYVNTLDITTLDHNSRLKKMETVYFDDIDPNTDEPVTTTSTVSNDDFDGLGHYRVSETAGFGAATTRRTTANFNPNAGTFPGTHTLPSTTSPWLLNLFSYQETKEINTSGAVLSSAKTEFCFDSNNGFLKRRRTIAGGTIDATHDLLAVFESNGNGEVATASYYGGDGVPLPPEFDTCNTSISGPQYRITHEYDSGVLIRSQYDGTTFSSYDVDLYPLTSAISTSRDTAGIPTTYAYDTFGRVTEVHPQGAPWTEYEYDIPTTSSGIPSVTVRQRPEGTPKSTAAIAEQRYYFDGLGRLIQRKSAMPNDQWTTVKRTYDFMGRIAREYVPYFATSPDFDAAFTPPSYTEYTYDALGRNNVIKSPDGKETSTEYFGASQQRRTNDVATGVNEETPETTRYIYDYLGRLTDVVEPTGTVTQYSYDSAGHLTEVCQKATSGACGQKRTFTYDNRGFLVSEDHPESNAVSYTYDARGHSLTKSVVDDATSEANLEFSYDSAERLLEVQTYDAASSAFRSGKVFTYGDQNGSQNNVRGKLETATRYNYDAGNLVVKETYDYSDTAGRLMSTNTEITKDGVVLQTLNQSQTYDNAGNLQTLTYPTCHTISCGAPSWSSASFSYGNGFLEGVSGFADSISYTASGGVSEIDHSGPVVDTYTPDATGLRPKSIEFSGQSSCGSLSITSGSPADQAVAVNSTATVTVSASGATGYQWFEGNGTKISGQTGATYTTPPINGTKTFYVEAYNDCKTVKSRIVTVSNCTPPSITTGSPADQSIGPEQTATLTVSATGATSYQWYDSNGVAIAGATSSSYTTPSLTTTKTYYVKAISASCSATSRTATVTVRTLSAPSGLMAMATSTSSVTIAWNGVADAHHYVLERKANGSSFIPIQSEVTATNTTDSGCAANTTYVYRVRAASTTGAVTSSASNADLATTIAFTSLIPDVTDLQASHLDEMLNAVSAVRVAGGSAATTWSAILPVGTPAPAVDGDVLSQHILSLRTAMNSARTALGFAAISYTDPALTDYDIRLIHQTEIRGGAQ